MSTKEQTLTQARTGLVMNAAFFASILFDKLSIKWAPWVGTAGTDGRTIWLCEEFWMPLSHKQRVFLLAHEVCHAFLEHFARAKNFKDVGLCGQPFVPQVWNIACDLYINDLLIKSGIGEFIKSGVYDPSMGTCEEHVVEIYRRLLDKREEGGDGEGGSEGGEEGDERDGGGKGNSQEINKGSGGQHIGNAGIDQHIMPQKGASQASEFEWKQAVAQAKQAAKSVGKLPGALEEIIDDFLDPQIPWQEKLRHLVVRTAGRSTRTYRRPNRRKIIAPPHIYMPGKMSFGAGVMVWGVDTSGSVSTEELRQFFGEGANILSELRPVACYVMYCDAVVHSFEKVENVSDLALMAKEVKGRGGTSFQPVFDRVREENIEPDVLIYFTDLECSFPEQPNYPVIWCSSTKNVAPWGETVHVSMGEQT